jgi:hypothetical protein
MYAQVEGLSARSPTHRLRRLPWLGDREAVDALTPKLDHIVIDRGDQVASDAEAIGALPAGREILHREEKVYGAAIDLVIKG